MYMIYHLTPRPHMSKQKRYFSANWRERLRERALAFLDRSVTHIVLKLRGYSVLLRCGERLGHVQVRVPAHGSDTMERSLFIYFLKV